MIMDKIDLAIAVLLNICLLSKSKAFSNLELLEKQKPGMKPFEGHKVIRAFPKTNTDIDFITSLEYDPNIEVDFWQRSRNIDIHVTPDDYKKLDLYFQQRNIKYDVINDNLQRSLEEEQQAHYRHSHGWHGSYHCYDEIVQKINNLKNLYNYRAEMLNLGKSYEERDILGLEISEGRNIPNKQKAILICGQHAREWISPASCMYMMEKILQDYEKDPKTTKMINRLNWVIIPVVNPDGYVYTWKHDRLWRKNRQPNLDPNCHGTDLNRNWDYEFAGKGSSNWSCSDVYHGSAPFSTPEVKAVADYIKANRDRIFTFFDIHSYSQMWMYPWSYTKDRDAKDKTELHRVSTQAVIALRDKHNTDFQTGAGAAIIYEASGSGKDWNYGKMGVKYAFALELRDTGLKGFLLPKEEIIPSGEEILAALQNLSTTMIDYDVKKTVY